jgi:hypothetical protein
LIHHALTGPRSLRAPASKRDAAMYAWQQRPEAAFSARLLSMPRLLLEAGGQPTFRAFAEPGP